MRSFLLHPEQERRSEVEADLGVVVHQLHDALLVIQQSRYGIRRVTFRGDALVPVVVRVSGVLKFDRFERWILSRRLIEVAVNANIPHDSSPERSGSNTTKLRRPMVNLPLIGCFSPSGPKSAMACLEDRNRTRNEPGGSSICAGWSPRWKQASNDDPPSRKSNVSVLAA